MTADDKAFIREFFRNVTDTPLEPTDNRYIRIYEDQRIASADPVELMARAIEWTPGESVQLLSGFRGTGKSTELRRLRSRLRANGYIVTLCDIEDYLNLSTPVDVTDFLMALAGAFAEALGRVLEDEMMAEGYWTRLVNFLQRTRVEFTEAAVGADVMAAKVSLKANLKSDPTFKQKLQEKMAGHLGALVVEVRAFLKECTQKIRERHADKDVVLLVDSIEHLRGTSVNAQEVQSSVETLFAGHAEKLHLPDLHVVYTVPPYLKVRYANLGALYAPGGLKMLPAVRIGNEGDDKEFDAGVEACRRVVEGRGDWRRLLGEDALLKRLILSSGGHLRDLLRLIAEVLRRGNRLPIPLETVEDGIHQIRNEFLPIADSDAVWLARIATTHRASLEDAARLPDLARFLDTHLALAYQNHSEWYDVHPLIRAEVLAQAATVVQGRGA